MTPTPLPSRDPQGWTRRSVLAGAAGTAAVVPAAPVYAQTPALNEPITRAIPKTGERLPVLGLGTFMTFDLLPGAPRDRLQEVTRRYWDAGARMIDTSPLYGAGEVNAGDFAAKLGIGERMFVSNKLWATGEYLADAGAAERSLDASKLRLWRERIDLMHVHNLVNVEQNLPLLRAWKAEGRIRYLGVSHHDPAYFPVIARLMAEGDLDFVQVRYSIATRQAEERILRLAADRGVAVGAHMPFEKARLFRLVQDRPVPAFARAAGMETWAAFFLKWVLGHPAITVALAATSDPEHAGQNVAALRGPLPDAPTRARMLAHMEALPGFAELETTPWYPGKRYPGLVAQAQAARAARLQAGQSR
ncbi:aldo/keto reductase [Phenylobacterium terrae]|uniref:Aldo/keto reductase n=1 Tax=Phenylobacterium terrae TaxID=2665495 RepID=A0ABW4N6K0_9CAUL